MAFLDLGDPKRPVDAVFLHANGFNARTYRQLLGQLASRFRILAVDQRGHGGTSLETNLTNRRDWLDLRDDLLSFLAVLGINDVVLSGHSMGATACLLAAAADPPRSRRLVLFDPVILPPDHGEVPLTSPIVQSAQRRRAVFSNRTEAFESYKGRGAFKGWPEATLTDYVQDGFRDLPSGEVTLACAPAWEASGFAAHGHDSWEALRNTTCPVEILRAEVGSTFNLGGVDAVDATRIRIETVPGSTHFLPIEFPKLVRSALSAAILADTTVVTRTSTLA